MSADVIVVGAGVAGLAAASVLASSGAKVTVLERKPYVGGRAYSYEHPALGEVVDCQHVLLGCCTNLVHLLKNSNASDHVRWYDELTFLETNGSISRIKPGGLPAPSHATLSFLNAPMLSMADKAGVARGLLEFLRGYPQDDNESAEVWLKRTGQTERAIRHFWEPVLVGALNDSFANCSTKYAGQVFHEAFLKSAEGGRLGIPNIPLGALYGKVADAVRARGGEIVLRASVETMIHGDGAWVLRTADAEYSAESVILALPFEQMQKLLPQLPDDAARAKLTQDLQHFVHAPITTVHLWYDREIAGYDHAVLLDTGIQWIFNKSRIRRKQNEHYVELVISASAGQLHQERDEIIATSLHELELFFPRVREAKLLKSGILKEARATFSVVPGLDKHRPQARTAWPGLYLAGDWTRTGWPSTMESGVRSGYLAAEAVAEKSFLQPDLPATGMMRWLKK